ncbi:hypothetical protein C7974DRAFT_229485 [Boeremia exigua]|uniref:uncharacterized protein n=1 Tax=Boeremia exigua TaxID=749465 RepID=UPI001E8D2AF8|nr:uncharacterized protein C7974DRAFT_229485 [Boeremia exigua]KAH6620257.1 hypothetical protein C7974DRAFT_229485 [Boeremia exigua]
MPNNISPATFLYSSPALACKDPRDRFYGLLGLFGEVLVEVDYNKSVFEVYRDSVVQTVTDKLHVLSYVYHGPVYSRMEDVPSWTPDWEAFQGPRPMYGLQYKSEWASQRPVPECDLVLANAGILQLKGILCDIITTTTEALHLDDPHGKSTISRLQDILLKLWLDAPILPTLLSFARTLNHGSCLYPMKFNALSETEQEEWTISQIVALLGSLLPAQVQAAFRSNQPNGDAAAYKGKVLLSVIKRKLFHTSKAWFGLGPACMRPGDVVVVFHGGTSPFVLRPVEDRPHCYYLMGECYMEKLEDEGAYKMLGEGGVEERMFNLI